MNFLYLNLRHFLLLHSNLLHSNTISDRNSEMNCGLFVSQIHSGGKSADESKEADSTDTKREKVRVITLSGIDDAPDLIFRVRDDEEMAELVDSISTFGVINPVTVSKGEGERFELVSGHRLSLEIAKAYKTKLDAIKRQVQGQTDSSRAMGEQ